MELIDSANKHLIGIMTMQLSFHSLDIVHFDLAMLALCKQRQEINHLHMLDFGSRVEPREVRMRNWKPLSLIRLIEGEKVYHSSP